jgi:hypothetical protein
LSASPLVVQRADADVLPDGQPPEGLRDLVREAHALPCQRVARETRRVAPEDLHVPGRDAVLSREDLQQRALAGPVRPDDPKRLATADVDADVGQRRNAAEALGHLAHRGRRSHSPQ